MRIGRIIRRKFTKENVCVSEIETIDNGRGVVAKESVI